VTGLRNAGHQSVSIISQHVDASLSDHLNNVGIAHQIVGGLPDSVTSALQAQFEMLCYAASGVTADPIRRGLGIFITSTERGVNAPRTARMIAGQVAAPTTLSAHLTQLESSLACATSVPEVLDLIAQVPERIGPTRGGRAWARSIVILP
jgi:hypothetical protein